VHGHNEEMVGKAFEGKRQKAFIQTKVHLHDEKKMRASVERSLRRLRTDYIDVLQNIELCSKCSMCNIVCRRGLDMKAQMEMVQKLIVRSWESIIRG
jgi:aryl-alcohol dehydrogenase-like predicted oxidoreductase